MRTGNCLRYCSCVALAVEPMKREGASFYLLAAVLASSSLREAEHHDYMGLCAQPCVGLNERILMFTNEQMPQTV